MNNSFIAIENVSLELDDVVDNTAQLRQKETDIIAIIEAINRLMENKDWLILKEKIFDGVVENLLRLRNTEVEKKPLNGPVIHSLNGQLSWAKKYSNLDSLAIIYKQDLTKIRKLLYGKDN